MAAPDHAQQPDQRFFLLPRGRPHMTVRAGGPEPLPSWRPAAKARHVGGRPGLVDEDETSRIKVELALEPGLPPRQDVRTVLLRGVNTLF